MNFANFIRLSRRNPGFVAAAILTLAVGIGANTAVFSVLYNVLLRPLPYRDADSLVVITGTRKDVTNRNPVAPADFVDWQQQNKSFESMAAAELWGANLTTPDGAEPLRGMRVSYNLFDVLGVSPALGSSFQAIDDTTERKVAIISDGLWRRRFGSDPGIAGRTVRINGEGFTIIAVMPAHFHFAPFWAPRMEIWTPLVFTPERRANRGAQSLRVFARLKPGVEPGTAMAEMSGIASAIERANPATNANRGVRVENLLDVSVGDTRSMLWMLLGAVTLVLLLACSNVANLLLARAVTRQREIAVRNALGASRSAVVSQLLSENLWLAVSGGLAGVVMARWTLDLVLSVLPNDTVPRQTEIAFLPQVWIFAAGVSLVTVLLFGLLPALHLAAVQASEALRSSGRGSSASAWQRKLMRAGLTGQVALALTLLIGAGLLFRSFQNLLSIDPGFRSEGVVIAPLSTAGSGITNKAEFYQQLFAKLRAIPGVESASLINHAPIAGDEWGTSFSVEGRPEPSPAETPRAVYRVAFPDYFRTMRIPLMAGRDFTLNDHQHAGRVVVVNEALAGRFFAGQDAIGKRLKQGRAGSEEPWLTIVGVVRDVKQQAWIAPSEPEIYLPFLQDESYRDSAAAMFSMTAVVRGTGQLAESIREQVRSLNSAVAVSRVQTLDDAISHAVARPRLALMLLGWFAGIALLLAAIGLYATTSFVVNERTRELGIRVAVGAQPSQVYSLLARDALRVIAAGVALGIGGTILVSAALREMLYQVSPSDLATYGIVTAFLVLVSVMATMLPARRAARIDPLVVLRDE